MTTETAEPSALRAARAGDAAAFAELTAPYRRELHAHCYRMLGSLDDADDLLQDTLTDAWRRIGGFAGRSSLRSWLHRIATNRCLNAIRAGRRRPPPQPQPPFTPPPATERHDVGWMQPYPDALLDPQAAAESRAGLELAFVAALQRMPPRQTAVLLLADVYGFGLAETAELIGVGPTAAKGLLQRARAAARDRTGRTATGEAQPARQEDSGCSEPEPGTLELARRFADAFGRDDIATMITLLTDDAWLAMPPAPQLYRGRDAVAGFLQASAAGRGAPLLLRPTSANGRPAYGCYLPSPSGSGPAVAAGILVLDPGPTGIRSLHRFLVPSLHRHFGLPDEI